MSLYTREGAVELDHPVLLIAMEGWVDAGFSSTAAMATLLTSVQTERIALFDSDALLDHRARRPTMRVVDGVNTGLEWPEIQVRAGRDPGGTDVVALVGPEPDLQWRRFTNDVVSLATELGIRLVIAFGAFPTPVPHTRPVRITSTATSEELARRVGFVPGNIEVPAGITGALERGFALADIPAVGLWARVPHYVAATPFPAASVALLEALDRLAGITCDASDLRSAAEATRARVDELISQSAEHRAMVANLEERYDAEAAHIDVSGLPSGDEIAAELERFLRDEGAAG